MSRLAPNPKRSAARGTVGFVCAGDPMDVHYFSGIARFMIDALRRRGWRVEYLGREPVRFRWLPNKVKRIKHRVLTGSAPAPTAGVAPDVERHAAAVRDDLVRVKPDVVFAPVGTGLIARIPKRDDTPPIVHCSDATPKLLRGYAGYHEDLPRDDPREADEYGAVEVSDALVVSSAWAAQSLIDDYGADPGRVHVVPFGANLEGEASDADIANRSLGGPLELLIVSTDWHRKGGDIALEATGLLNERGVATKLHVVGFPPQPTPELSYAEFHGALHKVKPAQLQQLTDLYRRAHAMVLPTRADCTPIVLNEAAAFALPAFVSEVGGIPSLIEPGVTGHLLATGSSAQAWADALASWWRDRQRYPDAAKAARAHYRKRLDWSAWSASMDRLFAALLNRA